MNKIEKLNAEDIAAVVGGALPYTRVDRKTGEVVVYSDSGAEIGRYPAGSEVSSF